MIRLRSCLLRGHVVPLLVLAACGAPADGGSSSLDHTAQAATRAASVCELAGDHVLTSSTITSATTPQGQAVSIAYRTRAGDTGKAVWIDGPSQRRVEFYPGGTLLLAIDFPDRRTVAHARVSAAVASRQLAQFYYVFPQVRRIAESRGLLITSRGTSASGDCTAAYQEFGNCILNCSPGTVVPDGIGGTCHAAIYDPDFGCEFNDYCDDPNPCNACCDANIDCPGEGGGGGGFGIACDVDDIYCNALFAPGNTDW